MPVSLMRLAGTAFATVVLLGQSLVGGQIRTGVPGMGQPPPQTTVDHGVPYMPFRPGRLMTYETLTGDRFTLAFQGAVVVQWFDGTSRSVFPVQDSRCGCAVLFEVASGQVRAIGTVQTGRTDQWGEYIEVLPAEPLRGSEPVTTSVGRFDDVVRVHTQAGTAWFARGTGIIKTDRYIIIGLADAQPTTN